MPKYKDTGDGWHVEVVEEYTPQGTATKVPNAHRDRRGGRDDMVGGLLLSPPIDDPENHDSLPPAKFIGEDQPQVEAKSTDPIDSPTGYGQIVNNRDGVKLGFLNEIIAAARAQRQVVGTADSVPAPLPLLGKKVVPGGIQEMVNQQVKPSTDSNLDALSLAKILEEPDAVQQLIALLQVSDGPVSPPPASEAKGFDTCVGKEPVEVMLSGKFGRFRTKVSDVIICQDHVALLYTNLCGDADLAYEPPTGAPFTLTVPAAAGKYTNLEVSHLGLITKLPMLASTLVVFMRTDSPMLDERAPGEEQHEYDQS